MNHGKKEFVINLRDSPYDSKKLLDFADLTCSSSLFLNFFFLLVSETFSLKSYTFSSGSEVSNNPSCFWDLVLGSE